jgi:hypothetical protein
MIQIYTPPLPPVRVTTKQYLALIIPEHSNDRAVPGPQQVLYVTVGYWDDGYAVE